MSGLSEELGCEEEDSEFFIHHFEFETKYLHIVKLYLDPKKKPRHKVVELNIDFQIPLLHRSIASSRGEIFLTGGATYRAEQVRYLDTCYKFQSEDNTLYECNRMEIRRIQHAIAYLDGYVYVIGGLGKVKFKEVDPAGRTIKGLRQEPLKHCERYDIQFNRWERIADLNYPCYCACACVYNNRLIYKFSGKLG